MLIEFDILNEVRGAWQEWWPRGGFRHLGFSHSGWQQAKDIVSTLVYIPLFFLFLCLAKVLVMCILLFRGSRIHYIKWRSDRQLLRGIAYSGLQRKGTMTTTSPRDRKPRAQDESLLFTRLPVEIRRRILIDVFGNKTLHMDLRLRRCIHPILGKSSNAWITQPWARAPLTWMHAGILKVKAKPQRSDSKLMWRWFSCVCHRFPAFGPDHLPYGRRCNQASAAWREPQGDVCLKGGGHCTDWPQNAGCLIGIMGWLLLCRQAYIEGVEILYRFNTISISSQILIRGFQDIIAPRVVSSIVSLELVWDIEQLPIEQAFTGLAQLGQREETTSQRPLFPDLKHLRIGFSNKTLEINGRHGIGTLKMQLVAYALPAVDELLERIAPPEAEVTFSCRTWDWFSTIRDTLNTNEGAREPCQPSELGGLKCWRKTPRRVVVVGKGEDEGGQKGDRMLEEGKGPSVPQREGIWIHGIRLR